MAAIYQDIVVGQATPDAPACSANIPTALPITLITLEIRETFIVTEVFPIVLYNPAPALYMAFAGKESATIHMYVSHAFIVAGSVDGYIK